VPSAEHEAAHNLLTRLVHLSLDSTVACLARYAGEGHRRYPAPDWTAWRDEAERET
jgi:hypothetical protein